MLSVLFFQQYQTLSHYFFVSRILIEMSDVNLILLYSPSFFFLETVKVVSLLDPTFCYKCVWVFPPHPVWRFICHCIKILISLYFWRILIFFKDFLPFYFFSPMEFLVWKKGVICFIYPFTYYLLNDLRKLTSLSKRDSTYLINVCYFCHEKAAA